MLRLVQSIRIVVTPTMLVIIFCCITTATTAWGSTAATSFAAATSGRFVFTEGLLFYLLCLADMACTAGFWRKPSWCLSSRVVDATVVFVAPSNDTEASSGQLGESSEDTLQLSGAYSPEAGCAILFPFISTAEYKMIVAKYPIRPLDTDFSVSLLEPFITHRGNSSRFRNLLYGITVVAPCFLIMFAFAVPLSPLEDGFWGSWLVMPITLGGVIHYFLSMVYVFLEMNTTLISLVGLVVTPAMFVLWNLVYNAVGGWPAVWPQAWMVIPILCSYLLMTGLYKVQKGKAHTFPEGGFKWGLMIILFTLPFYAIIFSFVVYPLLCVAHPELQVLWCVLLQMTRVLANGLLTFMLAKADFNGTAMLNARVFSESPGVLINVLVLTGDTNVWTFAFICGVDLLHQAWLLLVLNTERGTAAEAFWGVIWSVLPSACRPQRARAADDHQPMQEKEQDEDSDGRRLKVFNGQREVDVDGHSRARNAHTCTHLHTRALAHT